MKIIFLLYLYLQSSLNKETTSDTESKFSSAATDSIVEMGIQFSVTDTKRNQPILKYWVKG